jgi:hypothetical protein
MMPDLFVLILNALVCIVNLVCFALNRNGINGAVGLVNLFVVIAYAVKLYVGRI